jgi:anti-sigma-K factor RskA
MDFHQIKLFGICKDEGAKLENLYQHTREIAFFLRVWKNYFHPLKQMQPSGCIVPKRLLSSSRNTIFAAVLKSKI